MSDTFKGETAASTGLCLLGLFGLAAFQSVAGLHTQTNKVEAWVKVGTCTIGLEKGFGLYLQQFPQPPWTLRVGLLTLRTRLANPGRFVYWQKKARSEVAAP
jgi:hypothetical protein